MNIGDKIPSLHFDTTHEKTSFENYKGKWLVIYFYPKDATPGCTTEGCDFRDTFESFVSLNAVIFGISRDGLTSHNKFKAKEGFPFELISDTEEKLCQLFDVIKMKSMYGKQVRGIERSTFIIDPEGILRCIWRKVSVKGHVAEVLKELQSLATK
jgi:peroxiredoxin Q/BCP